MLTNSRQLYICSVGLLFQPVLLLPGRGKQQGESEGLVGMIYKRGKTYWIKYYRNGKPYRESTRSHKETDAKRLLKRREGEISEGKLPGIYFDRVRFDELAALRAMLNLGAKQTPPKVNRVPYIPMLSENNVRQGFFEDIEFETLRDALPSYLQGFATFGYLTGWRKEEVSGLVWDRVDMNNRTVRLNPGETKNKQGRNMYMEDELVVVMEEQLADKRKGCPYVFHRDGQRIKDIRFTWNRACRETG